MEHKRRSYGQNCVLAHAVDRVGERWTLLIIRDLLVRPRRYGELLSSLKGIGTNLLAKRLKQLEQDGIIEVLSSEQGYSCYQLTPLGQRLEPAVLALVHWGFALGHKSNIANHHQHDWDLLAAKAAFQPNKVDFEQPISVGFTQPTPTWISIENGQFEFGFDQRDHYDVIVDDTLQATFLAPSKVTHSGSKKKLAHFLDCFEVET